SRAGSGAVVLHQALQRLDEPFDLFFGVVRGEARADPTALVVDPQFPRQRRGVAVAVCDDAPLLRQALCYLPRGVSFYPERDCRGLEDAVRASVELYLGDLVQ